MIEHCPNIGWPWIGSVLGVFTILLLIVIRLAQLTRQRLHQTTYILAERNQAEEAKQQLEKALLQGQKLQAIGTLASGIAHDFNNILYAIMGYVQMAEEDVEKNSIVHKNLGKVLEASKRGQELISRILAFSRRQQHERKPLLLRQTIESVLSLLRPTIPAGTQITMTAENDGYWVLGNQTQLHQVIVNIINNAVDAMDGEGTVTIHLDHVLATDPMLSQFPGIAANRYCKITIKDTGSGMDQATIARIFDPFFTTKEVGKGTGLGLATVHAIVKEHQGEIIVNSQLGSGTSFAILLPEYDNKEIDHGKNFTG